MIGPDFIETKRIPPRNDRDGELSVIIEPETMVRAVDHPIELRKGAKTGDVEMLPVGQWVRVGRQMRVSLRVHPSVPPTISARADFAPMQRWSARAQSYASETDTVGGGVQGIYTDPWKTGVLVD